MAEQAEYEEISSEDSDSVDICIEYLSEHVDTFIYKSTTFAEDAP
jgi:hypothetical protein